MGILVQKSADDATAELPPGEELQGGDSTLGILFAQGELADCTVTFMSQGEPYGQPATVEYGARVVPPAHDPEWQGDWDGKDEGVARPEFAGWCTDAAGKRAYDFERPVTSSFVLYTAFSQGAKVTVVFRGNGGTMEDPADGAMKETVTVEYWPGSPYRWLPQPMRTGYAFGGWFDNEDCAGEAITVESTVGEAGGELWAAWSPVTYHVRYVRNHPNATGDDVVEDHVYDEGSFAIKEGDARSGGLFGAPADMVFAGWNTVAKPTEANPGTPYAAGQTVSNPASTEGAYFDLYAQWREGPPIDPDTDVKVTFDAGRGAFADGATTVVRTVHKNDLVAELDEDPKRAGWQFVEWCRAGEAPEGGWSDEDAEGESAVPLGDAWDFGRDPVRADTTLHARWALRLDVTLPVEMGFGVDAESRKVTTPEADLYALKSRTVRSVQVEEVAVISNDDELETFFNLREGASGENAWKSALQGTKLWVWKTGPNGASSWATDFTREPDGAGGLSFALPLANAAGERGEYVRINPDGTLGETISGWRNVQKLNNGDYSENFRLDKFVHDGRDPSELPLKFGMGISGELEVETNLDGPKPLTHLIVTVSARQ